MILPKPLLIDSQQALRDCVEACRRSDAIAVDTEFMRTDTFFPILGLIQISDGESVWLIDPLPIEDFSGLDDLFNDQGVVKVFHSCSEDIEVLRHQLGSLPTPLFDTQTAAAFLGHGYSRGYSALVEKVLDIKLDKHETRSDWLQRPLTDSQLQYAAEDVYFLLKVYRSLVDGLEKTGRSEWMAAEMVELGAAARQPETLENYYLRVKGAWKLGQKELALLRELTLWREQEARARNRPRNRIIPDQSLLDLIRFRPDQVNALHRIEGFHPGVVRRYGETLLEILRDEPDLDGISELPAPLDRGDRGLLAECREIVEKKADTLGLSPELLAQKKDIEVLIRSRALGQLHLPRRLAGGWRHDIIGKDLYTHVANFTV